MKSNMIHSFTKAELVRVCDLAMRRMIDNNIENYAMEDQMLFKKCQTLKVSYGKKYGGLL